MKIFFPITVMAFCALYYSHACAQAQESADLPSGGDGQKAAATIEKSTEGQAADALQKVTVTSGRPGDREERRQSTAAKLVFGREELDRNGDTTLGEVLKRLPGVTLGGRPGRGGEIRMRGLGNGYTQILINGERAPRGFSPDSLTPDQVERIEVIRGPVAEFSTQAIAGTINIVLREEMKSQQTQIRLSEGFEQGRAAPNLSITYPGQVTIGLYTLSYLFSGSVFRNLQQDEVLTGNLGLDALSQPTLIEELSNRSQRSSKGIHLSPRLSLRTEGGDTLVLQPFLTRSYSDSVADEQLVRSLGEPAPYSNAHIVSSADSSMARGFGNWQHRFENNARLNLKFGLSASHSASDAVRFQYNEPGRLLESLVDTNQIHDRGGNMGGKLNAAFGDGHSLALGWDAEWSRRSQTRVSVDAAGTAQFADSGDNLSADTRRLSAFIQDEWEINPQWAANLGLRWEGIRTDSANPGNSTAPVSNASSVWSPVLHAVWRIPGRDKDQVRMSLTHSYRAPSLSDLIALPSLSHANSLTSPDRIGNPALKPELAAGIDFAVEHYLGRSGILSANVFMRSIDDLMRRQTYLQASIDGSAARWVSRPFNVGHAVTSGIELEAKFQWVEWFADAPAIDFRGNYSRFWSRVDDIPGPNNRLDQQARQTANIGLDYHVRGQPLTLGGGLNWTPGYLVQTSQSQATSAGMKRQLDVYGLWKFSPNTQLRISANNLLHSDYQTGSSATAADFSQIAGMTAKTYATWAIKLEWKI